MCPEAHPSGAPRRAPARPPLGARRPSRLALAALLLTVAFSAALATGAGQRAPTTHPVTATRLHRTSDEIAATSASTGQSNDGHDVPWGVLIAAAAALLALGLISLAVAGGLGRRPATVPRSRPSVPPGGPPAALAAATTLPAARTPHPASPPSDPPPSEARAPVLEACVIRWRADPDLSEFVAVRADATGALLARSPRFRWRSANPPPRRTAIVDAHAALLEGLRRDGWTLVDEARSRRWFERRLTRPVP